MVVNISVNSGAATKLMEHQHLLPSVGHDHMNQEAMPVITIAVGSFSPEVLLQLPMPLSGTPPRVSRGWAHTQELVKGP